MASDVWLAWLNLFSLHLSAAAFAYLLVLSVMPVSRSRTHGQKAWKSCRHFRVGATCFMVILLLNIVLWSWFPVYELAWTVQANPWVSTMVALAIAVPCLVLWLVAITDAGQETLWPLKRTQLFGGIYRHLRHPQTLGEMPLFVVAALLANSLFLVAWTMGFVVFFVPILIHYEEKDLVKRFGRSYLRYRRQTGAIIPKLRRNKG